MTTCSPHLKFQTHPIKPKRRRFRETTISSSADKSSPSPSPPPSQPMSPSPSNLNIRYSPTTISQIMDPSTTLHGGASAPDYYPSSFSKFNSALTAGLLNPMSPPPCSDKLTRSSPTLFEMMANEPDTLTRTQIPITPKSTLPTQDKQALIQQRIYNLLSCRSPESQFNDPNSSDVKLTLTSKDNLSVTMNVHRQILVAHSRFFAVKISDKWSKQLKNCSPYIVEIADCDDIEVYIETIRLMYCTDLRKKLLKENVPKVLGILKVSGFLLKIGNHK